MNTHYLGREEVDAYLRDLGRRLVSSGKPPNVWCAIGRSGASIAHRLFKVAKEDGSPLTGKLILIGHERDSEKITLQATDPDGDIKGQRVMIIDSSVHSGNTMLAVIRRLEKSGPASITSYTLILKRGSVIVPTFWAVTIADHDRAYFLLDRLPNNRLEAKNIQECHLRLVSREDLDLEPITGGLDSLDQITWADRLFDMECSDQDRRSYILEVCGQRVGYLTYSIRPALRGQTVLMIEEIVVDGAHQNVGHATTMLRWAETMARQSGAEELQLWAIDEARPVYVKSGFKPVAGPKLLDLGKEKYTLMYKRVIYHLHLPGGVAPW